VRERQVQIGEEVAARRLEAALAEQARMAAAYERAAGTPGEMASYVRLQASKLQVAVCDRMVSGLRRSARKRAEL
jgi:hypothetical protein